jgi:hydrogenase 3 maturation protease
VERLKQALRNSLSGVKKVAVLGVGSELRGDDAAGIRIAAEIAKIRKNNKAGCNLEVFIGATAPENLTGEIKRFNPEHLVIIDSADFGEKSGAVKLINPDAIKGFSSCTHTLPLGILTDYLSKSIGCKITIIGIQPKNLKFGAAISNEAGESIRFVCDTFKEILEG